MASDNPTSEAHASYTTPRLDLPTLLSKSYAAQREWEQRHEKLGEKIAANNMLRDFPKFQPRWCRGELWLKWVPILKKIRNGQRAIGDDAEERRDPPPGERLTLRDNLVRAVGPAELWIEERLGAFSGELQFPPLLEYVVRRFKKKCGLLFDDPEFPDFAERLEGYSGDTDNGCKLDDRERLSSRIADLDREGFDVDLLAELWARFPRQCERLKLPTPKGSAPQGADPGGESETGDATPSEAASVGRDGGKDHTGFVSADTLFIDHGIRQSRLSEAVRLGKVETQPGPRGYKDSDGREVRKLYHKKQAIKHCSVKRQPRK